MVLALIIGDFNIPHRAVDVPAAFRKLLVPGKIHVVLCTGNLTMADTAEWLRSIAPEAYFVKGELDTVARPLSRTIAIGDLRVGLVHGHALVPIDDTETLAIAARQLDVDVLVTGATGAVDCFELEGKLFVNPGSVTGTGGTAARPATAAADAMAPSFVLLDVQGAKVDVYVYQLVNGEVKIIKLGYAKPGVVDGAAPGAASVGAAPPADAAAAESGAVATVGAA
ncbi:MJ0936 family phosphodiesterase [Allomyces macrogynus ATCC 38327]|uniref:Vacuolar protein sorting-associated protein 29 n=1 Tax=Allomyces macrogynus (strain ATCC 38327) TaxID=578462 RepID=A0A0L0SCL2_ALLM3|nr:MJ0936 family phosphodiesterase [Allomyces macrogynus ATCC 38327]|eukprot:KNE60221.1 MJ0936 family phosphodiesterase [Allomyces macrogynus ATCC 38327]